MKKLKILEITAFSAGICGVWARVLAESKLLAEKGQEIHVFSSNIFRGEEPKKAKSFEIIDNVKVHRFPAFFNFGQNTFFWNFKKKALELKPDLIITHAYRQYYSTIALKIAKRLGIPCILVTHAPFLEKKLRKWKLNAAVFIYDNFIGRRIINQYSKIIAITKWEYPYLFALGAERKNIWYIPNGIPNEFLKIKIRKPRNKIKKILFLGRVAPIKDIETLIKAFSIVKKQYPEVELDFVGPAEKEYLGKIEGLIKKLNVKLNFIGPIYNLGKKIKIIDLADIFVLPSKREAMPQALIEAMARKKLVISSKTDGGKEIIEDGKTGLLFDIGNEIQFADKILFVLNQKNSKKIDKIKKNAFEHIKQFSWSEIIKKINGVIDEVIE